MIRTHGQQQMFSVAEATATNVFCAKAKRQQQMFSVRKRSDSHNYAKAI
ncbi:hypothetical protein [Lysinibacillus sp. FJAT-14222]|nr:hypothetical protein [Lysinibacillus sp. FJAT-14222]